MDVRTWAARSAIDALPFCRIIRSGRAGSPNPPQGHPSGLYPYGKGTGINIRTWAARSAITPYQKLFSRNDKWGL